MSASSIGAGKISVSPREIRTALERIRHEAAELDSKRTEAVRKSRTPRVRATLSNVILLLSAEDNSKSPGELERIITELCITHPSRFFVVQCASGESAGAEELRTAVSSRCVRADSGAYVCSEEIYITAAGDALSLVPHLLLSHLLPDLKTVLFILSDPAGGCTCSSHAAACTTPMAAFVSQVRNICDAMVIDSSTYGGCLQSIRALLGRGEDLSGDEQGDEMRPCIYDLSWRRLRRLREIITEQFDKERFLRSNVQLKEIKLWSAVEDVHAYLPGEALLLSGWILDSLSWNFKSSSTPTARDTLCALQFVTSFGEQAQVSIMAQLDENCEGLRNGQIARIEFIFEEHSNILKLSLRQLAETPFVESTLCVEAADSGQESCDYLSRRIPYSELSFAELMTWQLRSMERDPRFLAAFRKLFQLASSI